MKVQITYTNGSTSTHTKPCYLDALAFCRNGISYTGWSVQRVEIIIPDGSVIAVWDRSWDPVSQAAMLRPNAHHQTH